MSSRELDPSPAFVPARSIFQGLLGQTITRVAYEPWSVRLLFQTGELAIEGSWSLIRADGIVVDQDQEHSQREHFELWRIVSSEVLNFEFSDDPLPWFEMSATGQWSMKVVADEDGYEDWTLNSSGALVVCDGSRISVFAGSSQENG